VPAPVAANPFPDTVPMPIPVEIVVNSSVVNSAQVGQEIYEYLKDYVQVGGDIRLASVL